LRRARRTASVCFWVTITNIIVIVVIIVTAATIECFPGKYRENVLITLLPSDKSASGMFAIRTKKQRERIDSAVLEANQAAQIALQKADIAMARCVVSVLPAYRFTKPGFGFTRQASVDGSVLLFYRCCCGSNNAISQQKNT